MTAYKRLTLYERQKIEELLDHRLSFRKIAKTLGRDASTVSREIKNNRYRKDKKAKTGKVKCRERDECKVVGICRTCPFPKTLCRTCPNFDCRGRCSIYRKQGACTQIERAPWVCNGCPKKSYGCKRDVRMYYSASLADMKSCETRTESRSGFDMEEKYSEEVGELIKEGLGRGLSPYEISITYAARLEVSESTIYRMVNAGVGGCMNLELQRKVAFKPREHTKPKASTKHDKRRSYTAFQNLDEGRQATATEMDCIEGRRSDMQAALTLYNRPSHLQIPLLLAEHTQDEVIHVLSSVKDVCPAPLFKKLMATCLTDNGGEFSDEEVLDELFGGSVENPHLFYCNPGCSSNKPNCEKNHSEIRALLPKGKTPFDELDAWDMAVVASHVNSTPRKSLCGKSPIQMFSAYYGEDGKEFLYTLGVEEIPPDRLFLKPQILDIERKKRGLPPINWL